MPWYHAVVESAHDIQNPSSREKLLLLGERLGLGPRSHVLDVASGRGGPAILLAGAYGCHVTCVEKSEEFDVAARRRVQHAGVDDLIELIHADARQFTFEQERYDAGLCLGASFVWDGLRGTLEALIPAVRPGGFVVVGEPYWKRWPLPDVVDADWRKEFETLPRTAERFSDRGLVPVTLIEASLDDWDRYETLKWLTGEAWLTEHPDDPDADEISKELHASRDEYLHWQRDLLGWAIFVGRKAVAPPGRQGTHPDGT
jgi:SAM-dependent methyltransferase